MAFRVFFCKTETDLFLFELHFTLVRVKALVLTLTRIITILIVVSERVAIDILVQTGIHFRLFTCFKSFERNIANWVCTAGSEELSKEYIRLTG